MWYAFPDNSAPDMWEDIAEQGKPSRREVIADLVDSFSAYLRFTWQDGYDPGAFAAYLFDGVITEALSDDAYLARMRRGMLFKNHV